MYINCHAFGDQYRTNDTVIPGSRKLKLVFVLDKHDEKKELEVFNFTAAGGVALSMDNTDKSIHAFTEASMNTAYQKRWLLYLSTKNTILKKYDGRFKDIFQEAHYTQWKSKFNAEVIWIWISWAGDISAGVCLDGKTIKPEAAHGTVTTITGSIREVVKPA